MTLAALPASLEIREVGPRDGLQAEAPIEIADRIELVRRLAGCGLRDIEVASFVSPKAVPSMAGAAEVMAAALELVAGGEGARCFALVPNVRGAELALEAGATHLTVTVSASPAYNEKNVRMSVEASVATIEQIVALAAGRWVEPVVSCAFGSPYEGDLAAADVAELGARLLDLGCSAVTYADTTGMATPRRVAELVAATGPDIGLHLHETRGTGLVNAYAAMELGVRRFDTSVGGLGGSPFAAGAAGNLATEDLAHLCADLGVATGVDVDELVSVARWLSGVLGHDVPSRVAAAGPRWRLAEPDVPASRSSA